MVYESGDLWRFSWRLQWSDWLGCRAPGGVLMYGGRTYVCCLAESCFLGIDGVSEWTRDLERLSTD